MSTCGNCLRFQVSESFIITLPRILQSILLLFLCFSKQYSVYEYCISNAQWLRQTIVVEQFILKHDICEKNLKKLARIADKLEKNILSFRMHANEVLFYFCSSTSTSQHLQYQEFDQLIQGTSLKLISSTHFPYIALSPMLIYLQLSTIITI